MDIDIKVIGVGEFRSFGDEGRAGFIRLKTQYKTFDLSLSEDQLVAFLAGVFVSDRPPTDEEKAHATTLTPHTDDEEYKPSPVRSRAAESLSTEDSTELPSFGGTPEDEDFDLGGDDDEEGPIRLHAPAMVDDIAAAEEGL